MNFAEAGAVGRRAAAVLVLGVLTVLFLAGPSGATKATHDGWPPITGVVLINGDASNRPLDMRTGSDPFSFRDPEYRCNQAKKNNRCFIAIKACLARTSNYCAAPPVVPLSAARLHNELLGAGGNDVIHAGPGGDVIWGDYRYPQNPATQRDKLYGSRGNDHIYASHGTNVIHTGGGADKVYARVGRGEIHCDSATTLVKLSKRTKKVYRLFGCKRISLEAIGTER
jgi:hypothetical protein